MDFEAAKAQFGRILGHPKMSSIISALTEPLHTIWPTWRSALGQ